MVTPTVNNLFSKYIHITPQNEVRLINSKSVFRLYGMNPDREKAIIAGKYLARALRDIIIAETQGEC